ncbi:MAG: hypothetical protein IPI73_17025 [Betaproteobacteria bacterium]|nr:hypothetical protein [Betaproteobacteria bacterium]
MVTGQKPGTTMQQIPVRNYLPDGTPNTVRGDVHGERLLYPGGSGTFTPTSAAMQSDGKLLVAATLFRPSYDRDIVLIRLNPDGSYDNGFGQNGMVTLAENVGRVGDPAVSVGSNGQIAYLFGVTTHPYAPSSYFVIYILRADGSVDTSAPSAGRISVAITDPSISFEFRNNIVFASPPPRLAVHMPKLFWQYDLNVGGAIPPARYSQPDFAEFGFAFGGDTLWALGGNDSFPFTWQGFYGPYTYGRGVAVPYDAATFGTTTPPGISASFSALPATETIDDLQLQPDGGVLSLGTSTKYLSSFVLTKYKPNGLVDSDYAGGAGRIVIPAQSQVTCGPRMRLLKGTDGTATLLTSNIGCDTGAYRTRSLMRFLSDGAPDLEFGSTGTVALPSLDPTFDFGAGYVDSDGQATILILDLYPPFQQVDFVARPYPIRLGRDGKPAPGFNGSAPSTLTLDTNFPVNRRLDRLPDGRLQAVLVAGGNQHVGVTALRWLSDGALDPDSAIPATFTLPTGSAYSYALDLDTAVLPDGSTLVAIWEPSQRILLRLGPSGSQDMNFGIGGTARIDGILPVVPYSTVRLRVRLAVQPDGRILLAHTIPSNGGTAIAVARFSADGHPDTTFTAGARFDSQFAVTGADVASDIVRMPDGTLMAAGTSGGRALLLRLKGESTPSVQMQGVRESFNAALGHYFITADSREAAGIELGNAGAGWQSTGKTFPAWTDAGGFPDDASPVCRFYGTPGRGPNPHFYTIDADECAAVKNDPGWTYEGIAFFATTPSNEQCPNAMQPVHRAYNNRYAQNDSNHRYALSPSLLQPLVAQGWTVEGVVFCVPVNP